MTEPRLAIIGTVGLPARYGGFETLADALVRAAEARGIAHRVTVYCSARAAGPTPPATYRGAALVHLPFKANGVQSLVYDARALAHATRSGATAALLLGVPGGLALPWLRKTGGPRVVVNPDGIEWRRAKWNGAQRALLKLCEARAVRHADAVIADNPAIARHLKDRYRVAASYIPYGGDPLTAIAPADIADLTLPDAFALAVARAEPENNLALILDAFAARPDRPLVVLSNWSDTRTGRQLRARPWPPHIHLRDATYDPARLAAIRARAVCYIHGHSAGGTNPALVEAMWAGLPTAVFDCAFNRETTGGIAPVFGSADALAALLPDLARDTGIGPRLAAMARDRYSWDRVTAAYFDLLGVR